MNTEGMNVRTYAPQATSTEGLLEQVMKLDLMIPNVILMDSTGGDVYSGILLAGHLNRFKDTTVLCWYQHCMSAATYTLFTDVKNITLGPTVFLFHPVTSGVYGDCNTLDAHAYFTHRLVNDLSSITINRLPDLISATEDDIYADEEQAKKWGLIDATIPLSFDFSLITSTAADLLRL